MFVDLDLFLDFLTEQERDEKGTKVPEMKIDPGKEFKKEIKVSRKRRVEITIVSYWTQEEINEYKKAFTDDLRIVYIWTKLKKGDKVRLLEKIEILNNERRRKSPLDALIEKCEKEDEKEQEKKYRKKFLKE